MGHGHAIRFLALAVLAIAAATLRADNRALASGQWPHYSGDNGAMKYSPLDRIRRDNVAGLRIAWRRPQLDPTLLAGKPAPQLSNNFRSTPIMVDDVMYASNGVGLAEAFDPGTGKTIWVQDPGADGLRGASNRGVAYWGEGADARVITFRNRYLYALDPKTGKPIPGFGKDGAVDLNEGLGPLSRGYRWNSVPLVARDVIVMGSAMVDQDSATRVEGDPGDVRAYDVRTGQLRWTFHVIPQEGDPALKTWKGDSWRYTGAGNVCTAAGSISSSRLAASIIPPNSSRSACLSLRKNALAERQEPAPLRAERLI